jgi:hypothetical protein
MTYRSSLPLHFPVTASAHAVDETELPALHTWALPPDQEPSKQLAEAQQERVVLLAPLPHEEVGGAAVWICTAWLAERRGDPARAASLCAARGRAVV